MKNIFKIKTTNKIMKRITLTATIDMIFIMLLTGLVMFLMSMQASAQNVGINNTTPHTKSLLDLTSSDKGLLTPRMTEAQRVAMFAAPDASAKGMLVYQTDNVQGFYVYNGTSWQMVNSNSGWGLTGNTGTNATSNFIGTGDNNDVVFKANNVEAMRIKANGKTGIGTANAYAKLTVASNDSGYVVSALQNTSASGYSGQWYVNSAGLLGGHTGFGNATTPKWQNSFYTGSIGNYPVIFTVFDQERMRIATDGKVGIGTSTPLQQLHVNGNLNMSNDTNNIRINNVRVLSTAGAANVFLGKYTGPVNTGSNNVFAGDSAGFSNTTGA